VEELAKEWALIIQAPWIAIGAVLGVAGLVWQVVSWSYAGRLSNAESELRLKNSQLDDYRDKLKGATPEEAKARIDALAADVSYLQKHALPRTLSESRLRDIETAARAAGFSTIAILYKELGFDTARLAEVLRSAFDAAGWGGITAPLSTGMMRYPGNGALAILVRDLDSQSRAEQAVVEGFTRSGLDFEVFQMMPGFGHANNEVVVLVTDPPGIGSPPRGPSSVELMFPPGVIR
jgi:hypothetical protein